jgi:hypothetical protein
MSAPLVLLALVDAAVPLAANEPNLAPLTSAAR